MRISVRLQTKLVRRELMPFMTPTQSLHTPVSNHVRANNVILPPLSEGHMVPRQFSSASSRLALGTKPEVAVVAIAGIRMGLGSTSKLLTDDTMFCSQLLSHM
jgi:hypothetical protein